MDCAIAGLDVVGQVSLVKGKRLSLTPATLGPRLVNISQLAGLYREEWVRYVRTVFVVSSAFIESLPRRDTFLLFIQIPSTDIIDLQVQRPTAYCTLGLLVERSLTTTPPCAHPRNSIPQPRRSLGMMSSPGCHTRSSRSCILRKLPGNHREDSCGFKSVRCFYHHNLYAVNQD